MPSGSKVDGRVKVFGTPALMSNVSSSTKVAATSRETRIVYVSPVGGWPRSFFSKVTVFPHTSVDPTSVATLAWSTRRSTLLLALLIVTLPFAGMVAEPSDHVTVTGELAPLLTVNQYATIAFDASTSLQMGLPVTAGGGGGWLQSTENVWS